MTNDELDSRQSYVSARTASSTDLGELFWIIPQEGRVHVAPGLPTLHHLAEAVEVKLPLEAAELVVCLKVRCRAVWQTR